MPVLRLYQNTQNFGNHSVIIRSCLNTRDIRNRKGYTDAMRNTLKPIITNGHVFNK